MTSAGSGISQRSTSSSNSSSNDGLYSDDGTRLPWQTVRKEVLIPHKIRVLDATNDQVLPKSLVCLLEANSQNLSKFDGRREAFREQVIDGRGFTESPLFPPNLLPSLENEPCLARCMAPSFSRDALPPRISTDTGSKNYNLPLPHPVLASGFSFGAFNKGELDTLPSWLYTPGTVAHFETGYVSSGVALYCPFLTFGHTFGQKQQRLEAANNKCAIAGAWSTQAIQMLYAEAWGTETAGKPESPISFSCTIDNDIAIINYHCIDSDHGFNMLPVGHFDLTQDEHFMQFMVWIESIEVWGVTFLLPGIKRALNVLARRTFHNTESRALKKLNVRHTSDDQKIITALKTTFASVPWRFEEDDYTPATTSTASWGSPIVDYLNFAPFKYPAITPLRNVHIEPDSPLSAMLETAILADDTKIFPPTPALGTTPIAPPAYAINEDDNIHKKLESALQNIQKLQVDIQSLKQELVQSRLVSRNEMTWMRNTLSCLLQKEKPAALPSLQGVATVTTNNDYINQLITTPTDPQAIRSWQEKIQPQRPQSSLNMVTSMNETPSPMSEEDSVETPRGDNTTTKNETEQFLTARVTNTFKQAWKTSTIAITSTTSSIPIVFKLVVLGVIVDFCFRTFMSADLTSNISPSVSSS